MFQEHLAAKAEETHRTAHTAQKRPGLGAPSVPTKAATLHQEITITSDRAPSIFAYFTSGCEIYASLCQVK